MTNRETYPLQWTITQHCCRICFGRVLTRVTFEGRKVFKCAECETEVQADGVVGLCCCGMKLRGGKDAGVRCIEQTNRTPMMPAMIVAAQVDAKTTPRS